MKNKIGWCNMTWNPVWGCRNHCEYCYARGIAKRFYRRMYELEVKRHFERHPTWAWTGDYLAGLRDFKPTFLYSQYCKKLPKKPQRIFVGSMSEIYYWREEWIEMVIEKVKQYPQHTFQFLTKHQETYSNYYGWPKNCILGVTITKADDYWKGKHNWYFFSSKNIKTFFSFEPLLSSIPITELLENSNINWVIIGAETGNRKGKVIPEKEWILDIVRYCVDKNIPLYLKDNIKNIYPEEMKEFPK